jgi:hypothetical protein
MTSPSTVTLRQATAADAARLHRLAELDSARALAGELLVAEVDGELWAAAELGGAAIADPFRPSGELVELLRLHAARSRRAGARSERALPRLRLLPRTD